MIPTIPIPNLPAAFTSGITSTDTRLLFALHLIATQHLARRATTIPFSPTNRIISRIIEGNPAHKVSYDTARLLMETISKKLYQAANIPQRVLLSPWQCVKMDATLSIRKLVKHGHFHLYAYPRELAAYC